MTCPKCQESIEYVTVSGVVVAVEAQQTTVYTDNGRVVTGRVRHECREHSQVQNEGDT